jgi:putative cell wall-binding protein
MMRAGKETGAAMGDVQLRISRRCRSAFLMAILTLAFGGLVTPARPAAALTDGDVQYDYGFRLAGADRFETAAVLAGDGWRNGAPAALLVTGFNWPDAIAAGPVGATNDMPILLTGRDALPLTTQLALRDLKVGRLILVGGEAVISAQLQTELSKSFQVERVFGPDRYATAAALAARVRTAVNFQANVVRGDQFPDALQASLSWSDEPVLLVPAGQGLTKETTDYLSAARPYQVWGFGDPAAVGAAAASVQALSIGWSLDTRIDAIDRSAAVVDPAAVSPKPDVVLVSGVNWPDAIAATPWAWHWGFISFLTMDTCLRQNLFDKLDAIDPISNAGIIGGPAAVSDDVANGKICST